MTFRLPSTFIVTGTEYLVGSLIEFNPQDDAPLSSNERQICVFKLTPVPLFVPLNRAHMSATIYTCENRPGCPFGLRLVLLRIMLYNTKYGELDLCVLSSARLSLCVIRCLWSDMVQCKFAIIPLTKFGHCSFSTTIRKYRETPCPRPRMTCSKHYY